VGIDNPVHLLFIAVVALVVLGPKRLPELTRALGHGIREFREAINQESSQSPQPVAAEPQVVAEPVDPGQAVRSGDAPDRGPL
jgi:TatA/E family protein of Tat protein translocase